MDWLRSYRPDLVAHYEQLYARGAYAPESERRRLSALLRRPGVPGPSSWRAVTEDEQDRPRAKAPAARQDSLF
jgi:transposase InsO family protein